MNAPDHPCPKCGGHRTVETQVCPACGHDPFPPTPLPTSPAKRSRRGGWILFSVALFLPAVLTLITASSQEVWPFFTFILSGLTALYCGFWSAAAICRNPGGRVALGLLFSIVAYIVSFSLCCAGCALGGAEFNIH